VRKWSNAKFYKFKKLSFICNKSFEVCDDVLEVVSCREQARGQYVAVVDTPISIQDQQHIMHLLGYTPTHVIHKNTTINRIF
jgi:hypothetical protein